MRVQVTPTQRIWRLDAGGPSAAHAIRVERSWSLGPDTVISGTHWFQPVSRLSYVDTPRQHGIVSVGGFLQFLIDGHLNKRLT